MQLRPPIEPLSMTTGTLRLPERVSKFEPSQPTFTAAASRPPLGSGLVLVQPSRPLGFRWDWDDDGPELGLRSPRNS